MRRARSHFRRSRRNVDIERAISLSLLDAPDAAGIALALRGFLANATFGLGEANAATALLSTVISVGIGFVARALAPKPKAQDQKWVHCSAR